MRTATAPADDSIGGVYGGCALHRESIGCTADAVRIARVGTTSDARHAWYVGDTAMSFIGDMQQA